MDKLISSTRVKLAFLWVLVVPYFLSGCASGTNPSNADKQTVVSAKSTALPVFSKLSKEEKDKAMDKALLEEFMQNSEQVVCEQASYRQCFKQTEKQCLQEVSIVKPTCINLIQEKRKTSNLAAGKHMFALTKCMQKLQVGAFYKKDPKISACSEKAIINFTSSPYSSKVENVVAARFIVAESELEEAFCKKPGPANCNSANSQQCKAKIRLLKKPCMDQVINQIKAGKIEGGKQIGVALTICIANRHKCL